MTRGTDAPSVPSLDGAASRAALPVTEAPSGELAGSAAELGPSAFGAAGSQDDQGSSGGQALQMFH